MEEEDGQENSSKNQEIIKIEKDTEILRDDPLVENTDDLDGEFLENSEANIDRVEELKEEELNDDDDGIEDFQIEKETYNEKRLRIAKERYLF